MREILPPGAYRVPAKPAEAELREKGSRFLAIVQPVETENTARLRLEEVKGRYPAATHHCWAWRLGSPEIERFSDAGEPTGTAGEPILRVLRGVRLTDVLVIVVRWFGGIKLGKGGLARAYAGVVREAVSGLSVLVKIPRVKITIDTTYERMGAVKKLLRSPEIDLVAEEYGDAVRLVVRVAKHRQQELESKLANLQLLIN